MRQLIFAVATTLFLTQFLPAQYPKGKDFDAALEGLIQECAKPSKRTRKHLEDLIAEFGSDKDLLRSRRYALSQIALRIAFAQNRQKVDPAQLISGKLIKWKPRSGKIELSYGKDNRADWDEARGWLRHPLSFAGPFEISFSGRQYGSSQNSAVLQLMNDEASQSSIVVQFGVTGAGRVYYQNIRLVGPEGKSETLDEGGASQCEAGAPFKLKVKVSRGRVQAYVGRKRILSAKVDRNRPFGSLVMNSFPWEEMKISGEVSPLWLEGLVEAKKREMLAEFSKTTTPKTLLPGWLFEDPEVLRDRRLEIASEPEFEGKVRDAWRNAFDLIQRGGFGELRGRLSTYKRQGLPKGYLRYCEGYALRDEGKLPESLKRFQEASSLLPEYYPIVAAELEAYLLVGDLPGLAKAGAALLQRFGAANGVMESVLSQLCLAQQWEMVEKELRRFRRGSQSFRGSNALAFLEQALWLQKRGGPLRFGEVRVAAGQIELRGVSVQRRLRALRKSVERIPNDFAEQYPELVKALPEKTVVIAIVDPVEWARFQDLLEDPEAGVGTFADSSILPLDLSKEDAEALQLLRYHFALRVLRRAFGSKISPLLMAGLCENFRKGKFDIDSKQFEPLRTEVSVLPLLSAMLSDGEHLHPTLVNPYGALLIQHLGVSSEKNRALLGRMLTERLAGYSGHALQEKVFDAATYQALDAELKQRLAGQ
ncbi:MAG: hypothetical protein CSA62_15415 [Planctomycetota bacterium]|nr:MAG: hypothetical protein CSA62_15415 [Planctomycetota bacterium]